MKNTSRKTIKKARKRKDHPAGCRVNDAELARIDADVADLKRASGMSISRGAYAKHAILEHGRLRRLDVAVKAIIAREDKRQDAEPVDLDVVIGELRAAAEAS
ncbi:MAG TPA: hypothetical protein VJZ73_13285 [Methylomirabilota bacterium]|nr:hypothetical protein [Methylomirabilota bacterium]